MNLTNNFDIPLYAAVWLLQDNYDYVSDPKYISATTLLKPIKEQVLSKRVDTTDQELDLSELIARRLGSSIHDSVEQSWKDKESLAKAMSQLGYDVEDFEVNPKKPDPSKIPVYLEQRSFKKIMGYTVGGKFDFCFNGQLHDLKTTSVFSYMQDRNDENYKLQGSIYRWLNPEIITSDSIKITFIFTDWMPSRVGTSEGYPEQRIAHKDIPLMSELETERWVSNRIKLVDSLQNSPEEDMPICTPEETWARPSVYKYYSKAGAARASKVFNSAPEAYAHLSSKGNVGVVVEVSEPPAKCQKYCSAYSICKQGQSYYEE